MDIRPPRKPTPMPPPPQADERKLPPAQPTVVDPGFDLPAESSVPPSGRAPERRRLPMFSSLIIALCAAVIGGVVVWYSWATSPVSNEPSTVRFVVKTGDTAVSIAEELYEYNLIRSRLAFNLYTHLSGTRGKLQAGGYVLSADQSVASIVEHMTSGKTDEFNITILPGLTLSELREQFKKDGFSDEEIDAAYSATYDHPLLASRPVGASLEGYLYPETYRMNADQNLQALFERAFDEMYEYLQQKNHLDEYARRNLTIHQAVTLASIIQKEVSDPSDQNQVAQVFLKRLAEGMPLQSDPTFIYPARLNGDRPSVGYDSPYNTYKNAGLPPGPIANFNGSALSAVALPAEGDFLYFVADRNGVTHFAKTLEAHNQNVARFCTDHCNDF